MSGFIFVLIMDWVMGHTNNRKSGLRWKLTSVLEDLDYADNVALQVDLLTSKRRLIDWWQPPALLGSR